MVKATLFQQLEVILSTPKKKDTGRFMFIDIGRLLKEGLAVEVSSRGQTLH